MIYFTESIVEDAVLAWFEGLGYAVVHGPDISPGGDTLTLALSQREREQYSDVVLKRRLRQALGHLNPDLPAEALEDSFRKLTRADAPSLVERNRALHLMLVDGVTVEYRRPDLPAPPACAWHADRQSDQARQAGGPDIAAGEPAAKGIMGLSL